MAHVRKKRKTYNFNSEWENDYFFILFKGNCVCLRCNKNISLPKKGNIERHYASIHNASGAFDKSYPLKSTLREEYLKKLKNELGAQKLTFTKGKNQSEAATVASYHVARILAKRKKPYADGEIIKEAALQEIADVLFHDFKNKGEIKSAINSLQLSGATMVRRIENMSLDILSQLKADFRSCKYFAMQLDESTDITDTAQLLVFVRMIFEDFSTKEEMVNVIPLKEHTTGEDIFVAVKELISSFEIVLEKLVGISTDGAPFMVGKKKGFIALCRQDPSFPKFISYHCVIHQQALCGTFLKLDSVMKTVIKIVNRVRAHSLQRRLFKVLCEEFDSHYGELLLHTEIRWLSRGRVLWRVHELLPALVQFFKVEDKDGETTTDFPQLEDSEWLQDFAFLVDITEKLNFLNLSLQGKNKNLSSMISDISSFSKKLELWE